MIDLSTLPELNSATKYPSIETYHVLDKKNGGLTEEIGPFAGYQGDVIWTEKINGTNGRIVLLPDDDYLIGTREELLYAKGDRMTSQTSPEATSLVETLRLVADRLDGDSASRATRIQVFYLEVFGRGIGREAKQYTGTSNIGCRLFDLAYIDPEVLTWGREEIARRRGRNDYQRWGSEYLLGRAAEQESLSLTPRRGVCPSADLPTSVEAMAELLEDTADSLVKLDPSAQGRAEGIVLRSPDRTVIAKARLEDYGRTLRRRSEPQGKRR